MPLDPTIIAVDVQVIHFFDAYVIPDAQVIQKSMHK